MKLQENKDFNTSNRITGEHAAEYEMSAATDRNDEHIEEMEKGIEPNDAQADRENDNKGKDGSHQEGQYGKQDDKPTMEPGSSR